MWLLWLFVLLESSLWSRVYGWRPQQSSARSPMMQVRQALLQKWRDKGTCRVPWVPILVASQTTKSDGLSQSRVRKNVSKRYFRKRAACCCRSDTGQKHAMPLHLRLKTFVDLLSKKTARHLGSTRATAECNISDIYSCGKGTQL